METLLILILLGNVIQQKQRTFIEHLFMCHVVLSVTLHVLTHLILKESYVIGVIIVSFYS